MQGRRVVWKARDKARAMAALAAADAAMIEKLTIGLDNGKT